MNRTPFKQLRQKFANDLEAILECPICLSQFKETVVQCCRGHNICEECYMLLPQKLCPLCKDKYSGSRNYLAQNLVKKFDEIKTSLTDPTNRINQITVQNKMNVGTQTSPLKLKRKANLDGISSNVNKNNQTSAENPPKRVSCYELRNRKIDQKENKQIKNKEPIQEQNSIEIMKPSANNIIILKPGAGKFPCLIGKCSKLLSNCLMVSHINEDHAKFFVDAGIVQGNEYTNKWKVIFKCNSIFDRAIYVHNMGLFFIKIVINEEGDVYGHPIHHNNSKEKVKNFKYNLSIGKNDSFFSYEGKVLSSRTDLLVETGLSITNKQVKDLMKKTRSLNYIIKITYIDQETKKN